MGSGFLKRESSAMEHALFISNIFVHVLCLLSDIADCFLTARLSLCPLLRLRLNCVLWLFLSATHLALVHGANAVFLDLW